jgi:hypothetical protein
MKIKRSKREYITPIASTTKRSRTPSPGTATDKSNLVNSSKGRLRSRRKRSNGRGRRTLRKATSGK